jgi:hypothetical protein
MPAFDLARGFGAALPAGDRQVLIKSFLHLARDTAPDHDYPDDQPLLTDPASWSASQRLDAWLRIAELQDQSNEQDRWMPPDLYALIPITVIDPQANQSYQILFSRYPVTNAQYWQFVEDRSSYEDEALWTSLTMYDVAKIEHIPVGEAAWNWFPRRVYSKYRLFDENDQGQKVGLEAKNLFNPVVVNWYEAAAFCAWLNRNEQAEYRRALPTTGHRTEFRLALEHEWVAAAGGEASGRYAWQRPGGDLVTADTIRLCANTYEGRIHQATPVFMFPAGASPYGVMDMSGNGREWAGNYFDSYRDTAACRSSHLIDAYRGSTVAERLGLPLDNRGVGFRVVCDLHSD